VITGMRSRPQLNGAKAEILSNGADGDGYLTVAIMDGGPRISRLKVHPCRLQPIIRSASAPAMDNFASLGRGFDDTPASAVSAWSEASPPKFKFDSVLPRAARRNNESVEGGPRCGPHVTQRKLSDRLAVANKGAAVTMDRPTGRRGMRTLPALPVLSMNSHTLRPMTCDGTAPRWTPSDA